MNTQKTILHVISGDLWAGAEVQAYTLLKFLKRDYSVNVVLMNDGELAQRLRLLNIPVIIIDESKNSFLSIFFQLRSLIIKLKPALIHTHRQKENILASFANLFSIRCACIRTQHGAPEFKGNWKTNLQRAIDDFSGRRLQDAIIAVSDDLKKKLSSSFSENKLHVVFNGVDVDLLREKAKLTEFKKKSIDKIHIGIIGRLVPVKRVDIFLKVAAYAKNKNYHFHVIGDGPLLNQLKSEAKQLDINDIVTFHGHREDIPSCIYSLDTVVMCSDHEGLPMTALETIALNKPLITREIPPFSSILKLDCVKNSEPYESNIWEAIKLKTEQGYRVLPLQEHFTAQAMTENTVNVMNVVIDNKSSGKY